MKKCTKCKIAKTKNEFYFFSFSKDKLNSWCKDCFKIAVKDAYLKRNYGIGLKKYDSILAEQNMGCAICDKKEDTFLPIHNHCKSLAVDHNKETGEIRGILCENCNRGIGLLNHKIELLQRAIEYLNRFN